MKESNNSPFTLQRAVKDDFICREDIIANMLATLLDGFCPGGLQKIILT